MVADRRASPDAAEGPRTHQRGVGLAARIIAEADRRKISIRINIGLKHKTGFGCSPGDQPDEIGFECRGAVGCRGLGKAEGMRMKEAKDASFRITQTAQR